MIFTSSVLSTRCTDTENLYRREREKRQRLEKKMGSPSSIAEKRAMTHEAKRGSYSFEQQQLPILFISSVDDDDDNDELGESRRQQQHYRLSQKI
jgi:hypothetical protein